MRLHKSITPQRVLDAVISDDAVGICIACGEETSGVEPDARYYRCESCGQKGVFGAEDLLFHVEGVVE
jgi:hypothetical protein